MALDRLENLPARRIFSRSAPSATSQSIRGTRGLTSVPARSDALVMDPALVTGATAVATGLLGYLGARLQHRAERDRIEIEHDRLRLDRARLDAEAAALKVQRLEQQLDRRRLLYLSYLTAAEDAWTLCDRHEPVHETDVDVWWRRYQEVRREVEVGAATQVVDAFREVDAALIELFPALVRASRIEDAKASYDARLRVWLDHGGTLDERLAALQSAMRADLDVAAG